MFSILKFPRAIASKSSYETASLCRVFLGLDSKTWSCRMLFMFLVRCTLCTKALARVYHHHAYICQQTNIYAVLHQFQFSDSNSHSIALDCSVSNGSSSSSSSPPHCYMLMALFVVFSLAWIISDSLGRESWGNFAVSSTSSEFISSKSPEEIGDTHNIFNWTKLASPLTLSSPINSLFSPPCVHHPIQFES